MHGEMLWFNEAKGYGFIRTAEGERLYVGANGFRAGEAPAGRCAGLAVTFDRLASDGEARATNVLFPPVVEAGRARLRHRAGRSL
jgi:cold shock CspA family protein